MATKFITVSIEIMHDDNLSSSQKFLLAEIEQLTELERGCIASNKHFSELIGIARESVSRNISGLEAKGYISTKIVNGTRNHVRVITLNNLSRPPKQTIKTPLTKGQETKENITTNKTINKYEDFLSLLKAKVSIKSKVTKTRDGKELFKNIPDKNKLFDEYIAYQLKEKEFSKKITAFMEDYSFHTSTSKDDSKNKFDGWK